MTVKWARLVYASTLGVLAFAVAFVLGTPLNLTLGPAMGGFVNAVVTAMIISIGCRAIERFPYATVIWLAFSVPAIFSMTMGPPGPHKLAIGLLTGLVMEGLFLVVGRSGKAYFLVGGVMSATMTAGILAAMMWLGLAPESAQKLASKIWVVLPIYFILGGVGMYLGHLVFDRRISKLNVVQRIRYESKEERGR